MAEDKREINVVVTGGTPDLHLGLEFNTSGLVRDVLPNEIVRSGKPKINLIKYPQGFPCIYTWIIDATKKIIAGDPAVFGDAAPVKNEPFTPDLIFHMGMTSRKDYSFETSARRGGYADPGQDGIPYPEQMLKNDGEWAKLPEKLYTKFDLHKMRERVLAVLPDVDIRVADGAGLYFCEFELWTALAELELQGLPAKAVFLHVPSGRSKEELALGARVAEELICAIFQG